MTTLPPAQFPLWGDGFPTTGTLSLIGLFEPLRGMVAIPSGADTVTLFDIASRDSLVHVTISEAGTPRPHGALHLDPSHLRSEPGPCLALPPVGFDIVATWRGWSPPAHLHPCPTGRAFVAAVECAAGVEPDVPVAQRLLADGDSSGLLVVGPPVRNELGMLCPWSVNLVIDAEETLEIRIEGTVHAPDAHPLDGFDADSWLLRRGAMESAQAVCRSSPRTCPMPRLRRAPARVATPVGNVTDHVITPDSPGEETK